MPTYVYRRKNGTTFEITQKMSDDPLTKDPKTGRAVQRVLMPPTIHFKGSGFYNTDYPSARSRGEKESGAEEKKEVSAKPEPKPKNKEGDTVSSQ